MSQDEIEVYLRLVTAFMGVPCIVQEAKTK